MKQLVLLLVVTLGGLVTSICGYELKPRQTATCSTSSATPSPTGVVCGEQGQLNRPQVYDSSTIPTARPTPEIDCRDNCLKELYCISFSYNTNNRTCTIYSRSLLEQRFKSATPGNGIYFWNRRCFSVTCPEANCVPSSSQLIQNPSFETNSGAPWKSSNNAATLVQSDAFDGSYSYKLDASAGKTPQIRQNIQAWNKSETYIIRYRTKLLSNTLSDPNNDGCYLYIKIDSFRYVQGLYYYTDSVPSSVWSLTEQEFSGAGLPRKANLEFELYCYSSQQQQGGDPQGVILLLDSVTVTKPAHNCKFVLKASGGGKTVNGRYLTGAGFNNYITFTPSFPAATRWSLDTYANTVFADDSKRPGDALYYSLVQQDLGDTSVTSLPPSVFVQNYTPLNCLIEPTTKGFSCECLGNTQFAKCSEYQALGLVGNSTCSSGSPIALTAIYV